MARGTLKSLDDKVSSHAPKKNHIKTFPNTRGKEKNSIKMFPKRKNRSGTKTQEYKWFRLQQ